MSRTYTLWLVTDAPIQEGIRTNENAGVDLFTAETRSGPVGETYLLDLGTKAMMTSDDTGMTVHYWLAPRSSIFKSGHIMANSMGVIDSSYRGPLKAPVVAVKEDAVGFKAGERHFQILAPDMGYIREIRKLDFLPETTRGSGGFGSTGR
jgi:dUTP pyrophosphatase